MIGPDQALAGYAELVRQRTGARSASLYLPAGSLRAVLVHAGAAPALPELADEETAARTGAALERSRRAGESGLLILLPDVESVLSGSLAGRDGSEGASDRRRSPASDTGTRPALLGLCWDRPGAVPEELLELTDPSHPDSGDGRGYRPWLLPLGGALAWYYRQTSLFLQDSVSGLPGRAAMETVLRQRMADACTGGNPVSLLLVNPDEFDRVNERLGREAGDGVIREIAERLRGAVRRSDFLCRFGGAVFGLMLPVTTEEDLRTVGRKLHTALGADPYAGGGIRLGFSLGAALGDERATDDSSEAARQLVRRADHALHQAKLAGGGRLSLWCPDEPEGTATEPFDRLSGIFTANESKDYRNMLLLWDTVRAVASTDDVESLRGWLLERLARAFHVEQVIMHEAGDDGELYEAARVSRGSGGVPGPADEEPGLRAAEIEELLGEVRRTRRVVQRAVAATGVGGGAMTVWSVPLLSERRLLGILTLCSKAGRVELDSADVRLLEALAGQLAVAMDRERLAERERLRLDAERRQLRRELHDLQRAMRDTTLVYGSSAMNELLDTVRRVAPTDATVLVYGESGTGKELVSRTMHRLSARRDKPLIVVDCSAIATSLIDSELFGHERGAYTGAEGRRTGRLAEADGGTLVLDEIGELPLGVQSKLLRFVQEKQFTTVGGTRPSRVDVRVIAATNRDLAAEVQAGRFREDLYYRLRVVQLVVPPLRERPDDVPLLADHFLQHFAAQYRRPVRRLSREAIVRLKDYRWPGNVRELQNRILQAVILAEGETLAVADLALGDPTRTSGPGVAGPASDPRSASASASTSTSTAERVIRPHAVPSPVNAPVNGRWPASPAPSPWDPLLAALGKRIELALHHTPARPVPLGKWIEEDLVLEAYGSAGENSRRAAARLGIPETTFRRRLRKASAGARAGLSPRPGDWQEVRSLVAGILLKENAGGEDLLAGARRRLLERLARRLPGNTAAGSSFMGVTEPTYRRWIAESDLPAGTG